MADMAAETEALIALMARHGIAEFEFRDETRALRIVNGMVHDADPSEEPESPEPLEIIRAPSVGWFHPLTREGFPRDAEPGEILGFVTAGSLRLPVVAPSRGTLLLACHPDDKPVGYGTALYEFRPAP